MGIIKQCTHPHSLPYIPTHLHPPKIFSRSSPPSQNNAPPTQNNTPYTQTHSIRPKCLLTVTHTKYGPITNIYSNFSLITRSGKFVILQKLIVVFMVAFTLSQSIYEFAKLRATRVMCASVVYVLMCQIAKVSNTCQRLIFYVPTCQ